MTAPLFPGFADELQDAAERAVALRRRRLPIVGGGLVIVLAVGGIATAATGVWRPQVGDERRGSPTISASQVPADQLRTLGVLRRDATAEDHGAEVRRALRYMGSRGYRGIRTDSVRLLDSGVPGAKTAGAEILIPAVRANGIDDALCLYTVDPTEGGGVGCYSARQVLDGTAVGSMQRTAPPTPAQAATNRRAFQRADAENRSRRAALRRRLASRLPTSGRARTRALRQAYAEQGLNGVEVKVVGMAPVEAVYSGLVPDGVARVVRRTATGDHGDDVTNNLFRITVPGDQRGPGTLVWLDADGREVKSVPG